MKDLQLFPLNELVRELGGASAQRLKNLALGVDDTPVTPSGAPQVGQEIHSFSILFSVKALGPELFVWQHSHSNEPLNGA